MALTEAQRDAFCDWMLDLLKNPTNQTTITNAKPGVTFDTAGLVTHLTGKDSAYTGKEGMVTSLEQQKRDAVAAANVALDDWYKASSEAADAVVGHLGKDHELSKIIRDKRDSMDNESPAPQV